MHNTSPSSVFRLFFNPDVLDLGEEALESLYIGSGRNFMRLAPSCYSRQYVLKRFATAFSRYMLVYMQVRVLTLLLHLIFIDNLNHRMGFLPMPKNSYIEPMTLRARFTAIYAH